MADKYIPLELPFFRHKGKEIAENYIISRFILNGLKMSVDFY